MVIDKKQFEQHLFQPESTFEILLRGHLWIESLINRVLEVHIVDATSLDLDRMTFRQKVDAAQAFGFIDREDGRAFRLLNRLRNKLAHDVMAVPSDDEVRDLIGSLAGRAKAVYDAVMRAPEVARQKAKDPRVAELRYWFFVYATHLDYLCAQQKYEKENDIKLLQVAAIQVASGMNGGEEIPVEEARREVGLADPPNPDAIWR